MIGQILLGIAPSRSRAEPGRTGSRRLAGADQLLDFAAQKKADLIAAAGYSPSRLQE